ncbi:acetate/propionate family kinase [Chromobacterium sp. IIBBL 290-4]|uniref:acetate/propionate family kinase n=1 Tax=Chromobacterium sp. IIBBL 290-4 TaxID=2953890 RepID=UPI0020B8C867|nr:acetate/propionate family kinase [Chromobacterium sp. IIBBL 290-4]UTH72355.1 acetate/propionate family kinase [Chromobacterium sp. IIBBL 290-4]
MTPCLLAINAGSSTLKFRAFSADGQTLLARGMVDRFGSKEAKLQLSDARGQPQTERPLDDASHQAALAAVLNSLADQQLQVRAVVHRVVHGGKRYHEPIRIDAAARAALDEYIPLAPLHQPVSLEVVDAFQELDDRLPQIACFDTAFHASQPEVATRFGIARHWHDEGVRRYGFHGLSYAAISRRLPELNLAHGKVVVCHLGNGASACAIESGKSIASSMGFSAVDGLMMGSRPGYIDPEVILYWQEHEGMGVKDVRRELYKNSGLLGVSGVSADMRELLDSELPAAREAVELFCYRAAREVASLAGALRGLDAVIFTAGIGEHSAEVRGRILQQLAWLGFELDHAANLAHSRRLTTQNSRLPAYALPTDEEGEMARQAARLL